MAIITAKLNNGLTVLGHTRGQAKTYANLTMARYALGRAEPELRALPGFKGAWVAGRWPFYVAVEFEEAR